MRAFAVSAMAAALAAGPALPAEAQSKPFGKGFDKWEFSQTKEKSGIVNCRGIRKAGGREDIIAMRTDGGAYVSVRADGRDGTYPESFIEADGITWTVTAKANGNRMWFEGLRPAAIEMMMAAGGYDYYLGGTEDNDKVRLGKRAAEAWSRVRECVVVSGG